MTTKVKKLGSRVGAKRPLQSHWQLVYRETRRRILALELPPGYPLSEVALARDFGISATPARDALGRLHQEGLVVAGPGRWYSVAGLSISSAGELAEARYVLESGIARLAIAKSTAAGIARVRTVAKVIEAEGLSPAELIDRNEAFHLALAELGGNKRLLDALRRVLEDSRRVFHLGISALPATEMAETHARLIDAIQNGDVNAALAVCEQEAFGTNNRVVARLLAGDAVAGRYIEIAPGSTESTAE
jgi:DNA-binding GntR family transcriptional regulator